MNARRVAAAEGVILAAQKTKRTAAGIAVALESACLLQSPESAAEARQLRDDVTGACLARYEEEQENARLRLAWQSARERAQAHSEGALRHVADRDTWKGWAKAAETEVSRLREERHSTNEALSDAAVQLRRDRDRIAELEAELAPFRALELGTAEGRISAKCENAKHPVWLRDLDDLGGCPWCRIAELEAGAEKAAGFCAQRAEYVDNLRNCNPNADHDYYRWTGHAEARRQLSHLLGLPVGWPVEDKPEGDPIAYGPAGVPCGCGKDAHSNLVPCRQAEDRHESELHHDYALGRDLPEVPPGPTTGQCGHDDYHDAHEWADKPHVWCPGHSYEADTEVTL